MAHETVLQPGTELNQYRVVKELGRGGMGLVYLAEEPDLDRFVALKVLAPELASDEKFIQRFRREARAAAGVRHPNIVPIYSIGEANGTHFFAMEYVEGDTLAGVLKQQGRLDSSQTASILLEIADALRVASKAGVTHRDLKPANILLDSDRRPHITDFGLALIAESQMQLTQTGVLVGSPYYMSPEQCEDAPVDYLSDQYSLGVIGYELLIGHPPFTGDNPLAVLRKTLEQLPIPLREVDPAVDHRLADVIHKLLAKKPQDRYGNPSELCVALKSCTQAYSETMTIAPTVTERSVPHPTPSPHIEPTQTFPALSRPTPKPQPKPSYKPIPTPKPPHTPTRNRRTSETLMPTMFRVSLLVFANALVCAGAGWLLNTHINNPKLFVLLLGVYGVVLPLLAKGSSGIITRILTIVLLPLLAGGIATLHPTSIPINTMIILSVFMALSWFAAEDVARNLFGLVPLFALTAIAAQTLAEIVAQPGLWALQPLTIGASLFVFTVVHNMQRNIAWLGWVSAVVWGGAAFELYRAQNSFNTMTYHGTMLILMCGFWPLAGAIIANRDQSSILGEILSWTQAIVLTTIAAGVLIFFQNRFIYIDWFPLIIGAGVLFLGSLVNQYENDERSLIWYFWTTLVLGLGLAGIAGVWVWSHLPLDASLMIVFGMCGGIIGLCRFVTEIVWVRLAPRRSYQLIVK